MCKVSFQLRPAAEKTLRASHGKAPRKRVSGSKEGGVSKAQGVEQCGWSNIRAVIREERGKSWEEKKLSSMKPCWRVRRTCGSSGKTERQSSEGCGGQTRSHFYFSCVHGISFTSLFAETAPAQWDLLSALCEHWRPSFTALLTLPIPRNCLTFSSFFFLISLSVVVRFIEMKRNNIPSGM